MTTGPAADVLAAEWIKLRSVRSTYWTVFVTAALTIAVAILTARNAAAHMTDLTPADRADFDPMLTVLTGLYVTQVGFGLLGVLAIGSEYATGLIRTTFTAVPRRLRVLAAKAVAVGVVAFAVGEVAALGAFAVARPILAGRHLDVAITDPGVPRALLGAGVFLSLMALIGLGLGAIIRHTAGTTAVLFGLVFVAPQAVGALPAPWDARVDPYLPPNLGRQIYALKPGTLSPGVATGWCAVYAAVALGLAAVLIARRDA
jgi:ABC-2 type transport system permease protein